MTADRCGDEKTWAGALRLAASRWPEKAAFVFESPTWRRGLTFGEWQAQGDEMATYLSRLGVESGGRVAVMAHGGPVWPIVQVAVSLLGAAIVPLNVRFRSDELTYVLGASRPRVVMVARRIGDGRANAALNEALDQLVRSRGPRPVTVTFDPPFEDLETERVAAGMVSGIAASAYSGHSGEPPDQVEPPSLVQFTSGTTAFPKGALLTQTASLRVARHFADRLGLGPDDVVYSTQPFYHVGGTVTTTLVPVTHGCCMVVPERYTPEETFRLVRTYKCTARYGQAAMYAMELDHPEFNAASFRTVRKGWAVGPSALLHRICREMGIEYLVQVYGLTETTAVSTMGDWRDPEPARLGSCGQPLPEVEVRLAALSDVDGDDLLGEICVRGWSVMAGYLDSEEDGIGSEAPVDPDGWFHTGDIGRFDECGNLQFVDRLKDMIKPGGENVSPAEIERVLLTHSHVKQACVVGVPDDRLGEMPQAFVELQEPSSCTDQELVEFCRSRMASFKVPRRVVFVTEWPLTESGKIQKQRLRELSGTQGQESIVGKSG